MCSAATPVQLWAQEPAPIWEPLDQRRSSDRRSDMTLREWVFCGEAAVKQAPAVFALKLQLYAHVARVKAKRW